LQRNGKTFDAMHFFHADLLPPRIRAVYALMSNEYNGSRSVQLRLHHWEPVPD
jgi:single-stranded-DNA-specific exonuclease